MGAKGGCNAAASLQDGHESRLRQSLQPIGGRNMGTGPAGEPRYKIISTRIYMTLVIRSILPVMTYYMHIMSIRTCEK